MKEVKMGLQKMGVRLSEEGSEWRLPILYVVDLVLCGESEKNLKV